MPEFCENQYGCSGAFLTGIDGSQRTLSILLCRFRLNSVFPYQWRTQDVWGGGGVQQIQLRTEDSENGELGAVAPKSVVLEAAVILYRKFHFI